MELTLSKKLLALAIVCFLVGSGCTTPGMHHSVQQRIPEAPKPSPKILAVYMPWFGDHSHIDVGYSSNDQSVIRRQIQQARRMDISAFVVDWYGDAAPFSDRNFALLDQAADEAHFQVALLYNESNDDSNEATDEAMAAMDKAYKNYIGPQAPHRGAYLTYNGHPMIFIFPKHGKVDWTVVAQHCQSWESPPAFIYKDESTAPNAGAFSGYYAWVQPGQQGWTPDGSNWGEQYLEYFYKNMSTNHRDKIVVGAAWPGFNDSAAEWGLNRHMASRCGKTLDDTMRLYQRYYDAAHPLPFLLIETWNDYEEGTAIERLSFAQCASQSQSAAAGK